MVLFVNRENKKEIWTGRDAFWRIMIVERRNHASFKLIVSPIGFHPLLFPLLEIKQIFSSFSSTFPFYFNEGNFHRHSNAFSRRRGQKYIVSYTKIYSYSIHSLHVWKDYGCYKFSLELLHLGQTREMKKKGGGINLLDGNIFLAFLWQFLWKNVDDDIVTGGELLWKGDNVKHFCD